jgi:Amt family ammonium transporter
LGRRTGFPKVAMSPHNLGYTVIGASMLWVGWFGFNAGSELAADGVAGMAMAVTQVAAAAAALAWMLSEWIWHGKPSVLGIVSGGVAGLVAITPASGSVGPMGAILIGLNAGVLCFLAATKLKLLLGYDDTLDVFGVHAIGGITGALLAGVFCAAEYGGSGFGGDIATIVEQVKVQAIGVGATVVYTAVVSYLILKIVGLFIRLRVDKEQETEGLDIAQHDERGYIL